MSDEELLRRLDLTIERLVKAHVTTDEAQAEIRRLVRSEPRTWDSADISYDRPEPA